MKLKELYIVLADDDADDCIFFKAAIEELLPFAKLTIVNDGEDLMRCLLKNELQVPDVIFLDINMPRKNGLECLSEMKKSPKLKEIPVIMFSTSNSWETINQLFETGANVYIHKPSDFGQLKQVIHHALPIAAEKIVSKYPLKYILNAANGVRPKHAKLS